MLWTDERPHNALSSCIVLPSFLPPSKPSLPPNPQTALPRPPSSFAVLRRVAGQEQEVADVQGKMREEMQRRDERIDDMYARCPSLPHSLTQSFSLSLPLAPVPLWAILPSG